MIHPDLLPQWVDSLKSKSAARLAEVSILTDGEAEAFVEAIITEHNRTLKEFDMNTVIDYIENS